jgi:hypothetical protein
MANMGISDSVVDWGKLNAGELMTIRYNSRCTYAAQYTKEAWQSNRASSFNTYLRISDFAAAILVGTGAAQLAGVFPDKFKPFVLGAAVIVPGELPFIVLMYALEPDRDDFQV